MRADRGRVLTQQFQPSYFVFMARPLRLEFPGAIYHVTARGNARNAIFLDDEDRALFLGGLGEVVTRFGWLCHAYCLMDNHYHLLIETPEGNLSLGMRQLNGIYTQRFNQRHGCVGHVFQGRFKAIVVDRDSYLLELCQYAVLNPIRAGMVEQIDHSTRANTHRPGSPLCARRHGPMARGNHPTYGCRARHLSQDTHPRTTYRRHYPRRNPT